MGFKVHENGGFVLDHVAVTATPRVAGTGFLNAAQVGQTLAKFSAAGKLTPAMMEPVSRLLSAPGEVHFSDGSTGSVAADVVALLDALPIVQPRGATVPANFSRHSNTISPELEAMAKRHGVDAKQLAANLAAESN